MSARHWGPFSALAAALAFASVGVGCGASQSRACSEATTCAGGDVCVASRCRPNDAPSGLASLAREIVAPDDIAYVLASEGLIAPSSRGSVSLGGSTAARGRILLHFPQPRADRDSIVAAYLVLDRAMDAAAGPDAITVRAAAIGQPWSTRALSGVTWASPPSSSPIADAAIVVSGAALAESPSAAAPGTVEAIRIDVTAYARALSRRVSDAQTSTWGLRVEGDGGGYGIPIATGAAGQRAPHLEIYSRR